MSIDSEANAVYQAAHIVFNLALNIDDDEAFHILRRAHKHLNERHEVLAALICVEVDTCLAFPK